MCLFSHATYLIRSCNDPFIGALNQQSTTIHEACPSCGKLLQANDGLSYDEDNNVRRTCRSCRKRVGLCFLCHEPVKGMYVWCPGCGKSMASSLCMCRVSSCLNLWLALLSSQATEATWTMLSSGLVEGKEQRCVRTARLDVDTNAIFSNTNRSVHFLGRLR